MAKIYDINDWMRLDLQEPIFYFLQIQSKIDNESNQHVIITAKDEFLKLAFSISEEYREPLLRSMNLIPTHRLYHMHFEAVPFLMWIPC